MSPFSHALHELRRCYGVRQGELAERMGYEQSYISALEVGIKGPPTDEFVTRLIQVFDLSADEEERLRQAATASHRKIVIPAEASEDLYWMLNELRGRISFLHPVQVKLIRDVLGVHQLLPKSSRESTTAPERRKRREAEM